MTNSSIRTAILTFLLLWCSNTIFAQCLSPKGEDIRRVIDPGTGQEFSGGFIPIEDFHFVQFAVYTGDRNPAEMRPPQGIGQVWLIAHYGTEIRNGKDHYGALYIVKPFTNAIIAEEAAIQYNKQGIECWYNPALTNSNFSIMRCTQSLLEQ